MPRSWVRLSLVLASLAPAAACVGVPSEERAQLPAWFTARLDQVENQPFPKLAEVPREVAPLREGDNWALIERELRQAGRELAADPRNVRADVAAALELERAAREELASPRAAPPAP